MKSVDEKENGNFWALKVFDEKVDALNREHQTFKYLRKLHLPPSVMQSLSFLSPSCEHASYLEGSSAGCILLGPVGESLRDAKRSVELFCRLMHSLFTLHVHGICHGDPRMPNVIEVKCSDSSDSSPSRLVWIDLRETKCEYFSEGSVVIDFRLFLLDFFSHRKETYFSSMEREYLSLWEMYKVGKDQNQNQNAEAASSAAAAAPTTSFSTAINKFAEDVWNSMQEGL